LKISEVEQNAEQYILHNKKEAVLATTNLHVLKAYNQRDSNYATGRDMVLAIYLPLSLGYTCWNLAVGFGPWPNTNSKILMAYSYLAGDGTKV
jgi:hypothetical protein